MRTSDMVCEILSAAGDVISYIIGLADSDDEADRRLALLQVKRFKALRDDVLHGDRAKAEKILEERFGK